MIELTLIVVIGLAIIMQGYLLMLIKNILKLHKEKILELDENYKRLIKYISK